MSVVRLPGSMVLGVGVLSIGLSLAGCGASGSDAAASGSSTTATSATSAAPTSSAPSSPSPTSPSPSPTADTSAAPSGTVGGSTRCANPDGFSIAYPSDWVTEPSGAGASCAWFGPEPFTIVANTDQRPTPIGAKVDQTAFSDASAGGPGVVASTRTTVAGRPAVRLQELATGEGLNPKGTPSVHYVVDVEGVLPAGGVLVLSLVGSPSMPAAQLTTLTTVLDRMATTVQLSGR